MEVGIQLEWIWYYPDFMDNRELPEKDRLAVEIMPLDHKNRIKWGKKVKTFIPGGVRPDKKYAEETNAIEVSRDMFIRHTRNIKNCTVNGEDIENGQQLYDLDGVDGDLVVDISNAINRRSILTEGLVKNSSSLCDSSSAKSQTE